MCFWFPDKAESLQEDVNLQRKTDRKGNSNSSRLRNEGFSYLFKSFPRSFADFAELIHLRVRNKVMKKLTARTPAERTVSPISRVGIGKVGIVYTSISASASITKGT